MTGNMEGAEPQEIGKVSEAKQQLDRAAFEPEAVLEKVSDIKLSEDLEKAIVAAVDAVQGTPAVELPPEITDKIVITAPEDRKNTGTSGRAEPLKIDTVPLPERPAAGSREADGREAIGTWPTPEVPALETVQGYPEAIIDSNDGTNISAGEIKDTVGIIDSNDGSAHPSVTDLPNPVAPGAPPSPENPSTYAKIDSMSDQSGQDAATTTFDIGSVVLGENIIAAAIREGEPVGSSESINEGSDLLHKPSLADFPDTDEGKGAYNAAVEEYNALVAEAQSEEAVDNSQSNRIEADQYEEASMLRDELSDWPDGETREITVSTLEVGEDGRLVKVEKTINLTKEEAKVLLHKLEDHLSQLNERDSSEDSESSYRLQEGSLVVGDVSAAELPPGISDLLGDLVTEIEQDVVESDSNQENLNESGVSIQNYESTINTINGQISILQSLHGSLITDPRAVSITLLFAEKQSDGTYVMVPKLTKIGSWDLIPSIIESLQMDIMSIQFELKILMGGSDLDNPNQARGTQDQAWEGQSTDEEVVDGGGMGDDDDIYFMGGDPEVDGGGSGDSGL